MLNNKNRSPGLARSLASIAATPILLFSAGVAAQAQGMLFAQAPAAAPAFQLPSSLPSGTGVRVDGSSSMTMTNESLKQQLESKFPGTQVELAAGGTETALKALLEGRIDIAAIGRPLTDAETAQGLQQAALSREKIAIIVGAQNPFRGSLTAEQFAQIFQGQITNWSQVGGPDAPIRFVDRPTDSDTRQALSRYPVFQAAPFQTGATATQAAADDTAAIVKELGTDGISYAPVSQVTNQPGVAILPMHDTLPTDSRYPYSQPRVYVFKGNPNPGAIAFLGLATGATAQAAASALTPPAASGTTGTASSPAATAPAGSTAAGTAPATAPGTAPDSATAGSTAAGSTAAGDSAAPAAADQTAQTDRSGWNWWWLLLPLLGLPLLLWLFKGKGAAVPPVAAIAPERQGRMILTPRDCRNAYAYWEIPEAEFAEARRQGGRDLKLRLYDVTDAASADRLSDLSFKQFDCAADAPDLHLPIARDDRDYRAELGYLTSDNQWIPLARSGAVRVPACVPVSTGNGSTSGRMATPAEVAAVGALGAAGVAGTGIAAAAAARSLGGQTQALSPSRLILVPRSPERGYAYWEVPEARKAELKQQGGQNLALRLKDVTEGTDASSPNLRYFQCDERSPDLHIPLTPDRSYVAELGYVTSDKRWLSLAQSDAVRVPPAVESTFNPVSLPSPAEAAATAFRTGETPEAKPGVFGRLSDLAGEATGLAGDARNGAANLLEKATTGASTFAGNTTRAVGATIAGGTAAVTGAALGAKSLWERQSAAGKFEQPHDCRIILVPRSSQDAYAYWEVSESYKEALRNQGGTRLMLRVHDATNIDIDNEAPHSTQTFVCSETDQDRHVPIPVSDRDYIAEIGYMTSDDRWLRLIRSFHVHVPAAAAQQ